MSISTEYLVSSIQFIKGAISNDANSISVFSVLVIFTHSIFSDNSYLKFLSKSIVTSFHFMIISTLDKV